MLMLNRLINGELHLTDLENIKEPMKYFYCCLFLFFSAFLFAQQTDFVDFKTATVDVLINPEDRSISGRVTYTFDVLRHVDSIFISSRNISYKSLVLNGEEIEYFVKGKKLWLINDFK